MEDFQMSLFLLLDFKLQNTDKIFLFIFDCFCWNTSINQLGNGNYYNLSLKDSISHLNNWNVNLFYGDKPEIVQPETFLPEIILAEIFFYGAVMMT